MWGFFGVFLCLGGGVVFFLFCFVSGVFFWFNFSFLLFYIKKEKGEELI